MKKVLSGLLVAAMGGVLVTGCGSSDNKGASNSPTPAGTETASGDLREKELVKLDVAMMSTNKDDKEEVTKAINEITRKKLNVEVNLTFIAHVGLSNVRHRLFMLYGEKAWLAFFNNDEGAVAEIILPISSKLKGEENE